MSTYTEVGRALITLNGCSSGKKRKGGIRQRLQQQREDTAVTSELAAYLLEECFWGAMSPQQVQRIASLALRDAEKIKDSGDFPHDLQVLKSARGPECIGCLGR